MSYLFLFHYPLIIRVKSLVSHVEKIYTQYTRPQCIPTLPYNSVRGKSFFSIASTHLLVYTSQGFSGLCLDYSFKNFDSFTFLLLPRFLYCFSTSLSPKSMNKELYKSIYMTYHLYLRRKVLSKFVVEDDAGILHEIRLLNYR